MSETSGRAEGSLRRPERAGGWPAVAAREAMRHRRRVSEAMRRRREEGMRSGDELFF
jgi:hypothetical protein